MKVKSWIVYGPQGTGKTLYAKEIARKLGLKKIVEDWMPGMRFNEHDTLYLTIADGVELHLGTNRRVISIERAKIEFRLGEPVFR